MTEQTAKPASKSTISGGALRSMFGRGVGYIVQYAFVAVCTRALGGESAGTVLAMLSFVTIVAVVGRCGADSCGLREVSISFAAGDFARSRAQAMRILVFTLAVSASLLVVAWLLRASIVDALGLPVDERPELLLFIIPLMTLSGVLGELLRAIKRVLASALTQLIFLYLVPLAVLMPGLTGAQAGTLVTVAGLAGGAVLAILYGGAVFLSATRHDSRESVTSFEGLFRGAVHFTVMSVTTIFLANIDILSVSRYLGQADVAAYVACVRTAMAISLGLIGVGGILAPYVAAAYADNDRDSMGELIDGGSRWCMFLAMLAATPLLALGPHILSIFDAAFVRFAPVLGVLIIGQMINSAFGPLAVVVSMARGERYGAGVLVATAVVGSIAYWLLVPRFGLIGAAAVNVAIVVAWNTGLAVYVWRGSGSRAPFVRIAAGVLVLCGVWLVAGRVGGALTGALMTALLSTVLIGLGGWFLLLHASDRAAARAFVFAQFPRSQANEPGASNGAPK